MTTQLIDTCAAAKIEAAKGKLRAQLAKADALAAWAKAISERKPSPVTGGRLILERDIVGLETAEAEYRAAKGESTMSRRDDLIALRDAVQAGETPTNDLVWNALSERGRISVSGLHVLPAFKGSVDAALKFLSAVLPGWAWSIKTLATGNVQAWADRAYGLRQPGDHGTTKDNPARALLLATLNALIAEEDT